MTLRKAVQFNQQVNFRSLPSKKSYDTSIAKKNAYKLSLQQEKKTNFHK